MSNETGMQIFLQEREKALKEQLKALQQDEIKLQQNIEKLNSPELESVKSGIKQIEAELKVNIEAQEKIKNKKLQFEAIENIADNTLQEIDKKLIEQKTEKTYTATGITEKPNIDPQHLDVITGSIYAGGVAMALTVKKGKELYEDAKGWVQDKIEVSKEYREEDFSGKDKELPKETTPEKQIAKEIDNDEKKKEVRKNFDKEISDTYNRHEQAFKDLSEKQYIEIKRNEIQTPEMATRFQEQHKELRQQHLNEIQRLTEREAKVYKDLELVKERRDEINKSEQTINDKYDNALKETEKSFQKQVEYIEKRYEDVGEKDTKMNQLKVTIEKAKVDIEKDRNSGLKDFNDRKANIEQVKEVTKEMEDKERQKEIERQR